MSKNWAQVVVWQMGLRIRVNLLKAYWWHNESYGDFPNSSFKFSAAGTWILIKLDVKKATDINLVGCMTSNRRLIIVPWVSSLSRHLILVLRETIFGHCRLFIDCKKFLWCGWCSSTLAPSMKKHSTRIGCACNPNLRVPEKNSLHWLLQYQCGGR